MAYLSTRSPSAKMSVPVSPQRRPLERGPEPYDTLRPFGSEVKNTANFGSKYQFKADSNPAPGKYNIDQSDRFLSTRRKSPSARITTETSPYRRPVEPTPDPYSGHLTPFGSNIKPNIDFGSKYTFKTNDVPPPGKYDPNDSLTKSKTVVADFSS